VRGRWLVWLAVLAWLVMVGCEEGPTPTPTIAPETAVPPTPSSLPTFLAERSSSWPTSTAAPTSTPAYSAADLQATILARSPDPFTTFFIEGQRAFLGYGKSLLIDLARKTQ
jgi:hypothetical protein